MNKKNLYIYAILGTSRPKSYTGYALDLVVDELLSDRFQNIKSVEILRPNHVSLDFPDIISGDSDAEKIKKNIIKADGLIFATPEYHGSIAAMAKLIIENLGFPSVLKDKPIALLGCAARRSGAVKALEQLSVILTHVGALPIHHPTSIGSVRSAFDIHGNCIDRDIEGKIRNLATNLVMQLTK